LQNCVICPHQCGANRLNGPGGYCRTDAALPVSAVVLHQGEEPVLQGKNGVCNVFFAHCNLQCKFCQNHQISDNKSNIETIKYSIELLLNEILMHVDKGAHAVGFVSPSHVLPQVKVLINALKVLRKDVIIIYNTNAYDKATELAALEGLVDIWLPDLKYMDKQLGKELSGVSDYPEIAQLAIREMFRQKGTTLLLDSEGFAVSGLIIRHLVLPSRIQNSLDVLQFLCDDLSPRVWVSLMSQYFPTYRLKSHPEFGRKLRNDEYKLVLDYMESLGMHRGWQQAMDSPETYLPDFQNDSPFS